MLIALVLPTLAVAVFGADAVPRVRDVGEIPSGLPMPALPHLADFSLSLLAGPAAVAAPDATPRTHSPLQRHKPRPVRHRRHHAAAVGLTVAMTCRLPISPSRMSLRPGSLV